MTRTVWVFLAAVVVIVAATVGWVVISTGNARDDLASRTADAQSRVDAFEPAPRATVGTPMDGGAVVAPSTMAFANETSILHANDVVFINRVPGADYKRVGIRRADGTRELLDRTCDRLHVQGSVGLCLDGPIGLGRYDVDVIDFTSADLPILEHDVGVLPSRARVAADQRWASATMFASGTSYQDVGAFATYVTVTGLAPDDGPTVLLDRFALNQSDPSHTAFPDDRNYWGISWGENGDFWVTAGSDAAVELLTGRADTRELFTTGIAGSCPSLSPDGETLVYKRTRPDGGFDLVARTLRTGAERMLDESHSVDDQVEWLDNDTILYALHQGDPTVSQPEFDIWALDVTPGAAPVLFLPNANSPGAS